MRENELKRILSNVCDGYVDNILIDLEENKDNEKMFPFMLACVNFICELKKKNIMVELCGTFEDAIIDRIYREVGNYIGK